MGQRKNELDSEFAIPDEDDQITLGEIKSRNAPIIRGPE